MTEDLAARLLAAIEQTERTARDAETACWHVDYCDDRGAPFHQQHTPELVLDRCAADRRLLTLHGSVPLGNAPHIDVCLTCSPGVPGQVIRAAHLPYPCPTLTALAEGYGIEDAILRPEDVGLTPGDKIRASYVRDHPEYPWPEWMRAQAEKERPWT